MAEVVNPEPAVQPPVQNQQEAVPPVNPPATSDGVCSRFRRRQRNPDPDLVETTSDLSGVKIQHRFVAKHPTLWKVLVRLSWAGGIAILAWVFVGGYLLRGSHGSSVQTMTQTVTDSRIDKLVLVVEKLAEAKSKDVAVAPPVPPVTPPPVEPKAEPMVTPTQAPAPVKPVPVRVVGSVKVEILVKTEPTAPAGTQQLPSPPPLAAQPKDCSQYSGVERLSCERWARIK